MTNEIQPREQQQQQQQRPQQQTSGDQRSDNEPAGRVWRACLECRKKKSKCDGNETCRPCRNRNKECVYPESNDNAATSRQVLTTFEARFQQMEKWCQQMDMLIGKLANTIENLQNVVHDKNPPDIPPYTQDQQSNDPRQSRPEVLEDLTSEGMLLASAIDEPEIPLEYQVIEIETDETHDKVNEAPEDENDEDEIEDENEGGGFGAPEVTAKTKPDHIMTTDSYGNLRFVGGTSTMVMIEALKALSPSDTLGTASTYSPEKSVSILELPLFTRGKTFPRLPYIPPADQLQRPPRYVSDLLINIYFEQLHYTMPVLYKPHFMQRYNLLVNQRSSDNVDAGFLSVFFAVCACASGLLPREPGSSDSFTGLRYYENAILLHYASTGEGKIEQVQCLTLLSMCSAGWNTLAQSWKFAGHAVRAAQDLGLHRSPARGAGEPLKEELCRRTWWSLYSLDRMLSTCLGRPMGIEDADCDCEIPLDMDDYELEAFCKNNTQEAFLRRSASISPTSSRLSGFLSLVRLCQIMGKISRSMNSIQIQKSYEGPKEAANLKRLSEGLDLELEMWLKDLPDPIKYSANTTEAEGSGSMHLTMCVISYIVHAGCVINLHRPQIPDTSEGKVALTENPSFLKCFDAARSCIQTAELIPDRVPPSHHLAFCVQYLALSGIFLIRSSAPSAPSTAIVEEVETCARYLRALEITWTGTQRSRMIIEELLNQSKIYLTSKKRGFDDFEQDMVPGLDIGFTDFVFSAYQDPFADLFRTPDNGG